MRRFLAAMLLCLASSVSHAALVNNGTWTTDTATNLNWLDLTETNGLSYNYVSGQLGSGGQWEGWRYATTTETTALFQTLGLTIGSTSSTVNNAPAGFSTALTNFVNLFGNTYSSAQYFGSIGFTSQSDSTGTHQRLGALTFNYGAGYSLLTDPSGCCDNSDGTGYRDFGHYLVRDSVAPVPLPAAAWLLLSGMGGLGLLRKRKKPRRTNLE